MAVTLILDLNKN